LINKQLYIKVIFTKILQIEPIDLVSFDDSLVFNNCTGSGKTNIMNNYFPEELKKSYEDRIAHLEQEVFFLRGMLEKK
jgi:hypothetical protein